MDTIIVNEAINLVPYFENYDTTLKWYEDKDVCKQVDNIDFVYDIDRLQKMYNYLNNHGKLFYIEYNNELSLIHISEPTRREWLSRMPSSA